MSTFRAKYATASMGEGATEEHEKTQVPGKDGVDEGEEGGDPDAEDAQLHGVVHPKDDVIAEVMRKRRASVELRGVVDTDADTLLKE